ncbi:S1C family serine protease [Sphingomonas sp.]|uniref:S1C family serine protease n=1 Tax=Sphingomonas sp. TaxID=28214 RepID=UPI0025F7D1E0|nr:S1C family serine protease [Sphingomonas sp.]
MTEPDRPDLLGTQHRPWRRRLIQGLGIGLLILAGVMAGARLSRPVRTVEQRVTMPIREAVKRLTPLEQLSDNAASACPAIVSLRFRGLEGPAPQGVVVSADGQVVTTYPVPAEVSFEAWLDGRKLKGRVAARDPLTGISLLKLDGEGLPVLAVAESDIASPGSWGYTLSSPNSTGCIVEPAIVASDFATDGNGQSYYLRVHGTGEPVPAGTPFLSPDGRITALALPAIEQGGRQDRFLPADLVNIVVGRLMRGGNAATNAFGLMAEDLSPVLAARLGVDRGRGAVVVAVANDSIAHAAGLRVGDVILSAANTPISSSSELARTLGGNDPIEMAVSRGRERSRLTVTLAPRMPRRSTKLGS